MLVMLKEIIGDDLVDATINPNEVLSVKAVNKDGIQNSLIEMVGGKSLLVKGTVQEVTARLNSKRLLKG